MHFAGQSYFPEADRRMGKQSDADSKGAADPNEFLSGIEAMARELVKSYPFLSDSDKERFKTEKPEIGKCPRCGSPVHEGKKNYYCSNRNCAFVMWKNDRFLRTGK